MATRAIQKRRSVRARHCVRTRTGCARAAIDHHCESSESERKSRLKPVLLCEDAYAFSLIRYKGTRAKSIR
ncbi:unnamed protein product, partial [Iphiclides podalirius]